MNTDKTTTTAGARPENVRQYVAVAYAYPSSENATQFGFAKDGCFTVETSHSGDRIPKAIAGYSNSPDAFKHATELVAAGYIHCPYSVSPEFRVYRPLP
jgi:hypothetical protein